MYRLGLWFVLEGVHDPLRLNIFFGGIDDENFCEQPCHKHVGLHRPFGFVLAGKGAIFFEVGVRLDKT
jgi:hypothetical protein